MLQDYLTSLLEVENNIGFLGVPESVPLGDGTPGRSQHIRPVTQLSASSVHAEADSTDGLRRADAIVVHNGHLQVHFLLRTEQRETYA